VIADRIIDTAIGSAIAFIANIFIFPAWEHEQMTSYMLRMLHDNLAYFEDISRSYLGKAPLLSQHQLTRKNVFVSLANLSDAFNRMLSEPKSKQINAKKMHQFVVSNHMLTSHIATLSYYLPRFDPSKNQYDFTGIVKAIKTKLNHAETRLTNQRPPAGIEADENNWRHFNSLINELTERRKRELKMGIRDSETRRELANIKPVADQFNFIMNIATSLERWQALALPQG
jgi:uncharacterized membrane protein YccC